MKNNKKTTYFSVSSIVLMVVFGLFLGGNAFAKEVNLVNVVNLVNESRQANGLNKLFISSKLIDVASDKANDMITHHYFAHTSPQGLDPWYWFKKNNYNYEYAGENLAINYKTAEEQHRAWMKSPTHRKNILNPNYTEIGIATARGYIEGEPAFITVQVFGTPQKNADLISFIENKKQPTERVSSAFSPNSPYFTEQAHYLKPFESSNNQPNPSVNNFEKKSFQDSAFLKTIQSKQQEVLWLVILLLGIIITRDLVLSSINTSFIKHHSTTNIVLLLMLWSILISL